VAAWLLTVNEPVPSPVRFSLTLTDLDLPAANGRLVAISPDGQTLVYRARPAAGGVFRRYSRRLDAFEATPIGEENASNVIFSADSQWIGYTVGNTLRRVPIGGGPSELLVNLPAGANPATAWASDGTLLAGGPRLLRIRPGVNDPEALATAVAAGNVISSPQTLPNNRAAIFVEAPAQTIEERAVHVLNLQTGERRLLLEDAAAFRYLPSGHLVFWRGGALWAARFNPDDLAIVGEPALVVEGVRGESGGAVQFSIADDGTLVYIPGRPAQGNRRLVRVDRNGTERATGAPIRLYNHPRLSPDGRRIVVEDASNGDLWIFNLGPGTLERLTASPGAERSPVWLTDDRVVFSATRDNRPGVFAQRADGSGSSERLATTPRLFDSLTLHPNGRMLLGRSDEDIWLVPLDGSGPPTPLLQTPAQERNPEFSPNGSWVAYQSSEGGQAQIYVRPAPGRDGPRILVSPDVGADPMWSRDGKELFYYSTSAPPYLMRVPVDSGEVFTAVRPEPLFDISQHLSMFNLQGGARLIIARDRRL
jgi:serine/threonine-protein kinase